jgi:hypothetical protein
MDAALGIARPAVGAFAASFLSACSTFTEISLRALAGAGVGAALLPAPAAESARNLKGAILMVLAGSGLESWET